MGVIYVDVPDALVDVVGPRSGSDLCRIASHCIVPILSLEIPDCSREETGGDEVEEACRDDKEELEFGRSTAPGKRLDMQEVKVKRTYL